MSPIIIKRFLNIFKITTKVTFVSIPIAVIQRPFIRITVESGFVIIVPCFLHNSDTQGLGNFKFQIIC